MIPSRVSATSATIRVVASHTSWELSSRFDDETALRFNIGYALMTALRSRGDADLLTVRLFDTRTRDIVWADTYPLSATASPPRIARCRAPSPPPSPMPSSVPR